MNFRYVASYQTVSPVLFLIFNRPDTTVAVFEKIKEARPERLYIAADGPRLERPGEIKLSKEAKAIVEQVDWHCEIKTLFREKNLGCKYAVSSAIDWFFQHEEEGIILEDDCLPSADFFRFCDELLENYRDDNRVTQITGCNVQPGKRWGSASYYFSNNIEVWGWASWKRVWKNYDVELNNYNEKELEQHLQEIYKNRIVTQKFMEAFNELKEGKIDTWDYQLRFINFFQKGLVAVPNFNLISNIGFRADGTHTINSDHIFANIKTEQLPDIITHPSTFTACTEADLQTFYADFNIKKMSWLRRFRNLFKF
ncbi:nucleotide-diphospho-sugar transferase [Desertivirga brevis]|uniref:nucleotide-diphospho-sugar transferase n=1 Tax=Desertivirga brevis TaxID=2810310 RepID=UPI001A96CDE6|nr:nucleotide-diphospho-sugar transferase [Pedobacter sp. SYSU D00873]